VPKRSSATPFRWPIFRLPRGQPDRGAGAYQFTGYTIYDPLVAWEMNVADRPGKLVPGRSARPTPVVVVVTSETLKLRPPDVAAVLDEIAKKNDESGIIWRPGTENPRLIACAWLPMASHSDRSRRLSLTNKTGDRAGPGGPAHALTC
jgi:hypothetical protein